MVPTRHTRRHVWDTAGVHVVYAEDLLYMKHPAAAILRPVHRHETVRLADADTLTRWQLATRQLFVAN
jgi:hypothetical protein